MPELCEKAESGRTIHVCDTLADALRSGVLESSHHSTKMIETGEKIYRVAVVTRKYKGRYAAFSYCPFCGVYIDTQDYGFGVNDGVE